MYIPTEENTNSVSQNLFNILADQGRNGNRGRFSRETYKSFIGIVVAICGNILISVALNTQKYAHIKLNEKAAARRKLLRRAERRSQEASQERDDDRGANGPHRKRGSTDRLSSLKDGDADGNGHSRELAEEHERAPLLGGYQSNNDARHEADSDSNSQTKNEDDDGQKSYLKSPYWWIGIVLMIIGEGGNFLAYGFAPASIVSPLGVVAIISNCIIAPIFMKEPFRLRDFFGVVVAVGGAVTVVLSASESNPKLGPHEIWDLIARWEFETYLGITIALIIILMFASNKYGHKSVLIDLGLVGLFGGYTALSTKGVASLLSHTLFKALTYPVFYLLVAILVGTAVMQIKYVNRALQRFDSTQVIPTQFVMFTLSVIIGSAILYRDFEKTRGDAAGKFIGGCAMTFIGVWLITSGRQPPTEEEDDDYDSDEDAIVLRPGEQYQDDIHVNAASQETLTQPPLISIDEDNDNFGHAQSLSRQPSTLHPDPEQRLGRHSNVAAARPKTFDRQSALSTSDSGVIPSIQQRTEPVRSKSSLQRFLQPLAELFPDQSAKHTPQTLPSVLQSRHSTPSIPQVSNSLTPDPPQTPRQTSHDGTTMPTTTPVSNQRNRLLSRRSMNNIYPGPFTSPLSSSLSAMVSESLRRGMGIKKMRRRSTRPRLFHADTSNSQARQYPHQSGTSTATFGSSVPEQHNGLLPAFDDDEHRYSSGTGRSRSYTNDDFYDDDAREIDEPQSPGPSSSHSRKRSLGSRVGGFFWRAPGKNENGKGQKPTNEDDDDHDQIV